MNKGLKLGIEIGLGVVIVLLAYLSYHSVMVDLKFGEEKARRQALVIEKLLDARELQYAYEAKYSKYADTWDFRLFGFSIRLPAVFKDLMGQFCAIDRAAPPAMPEAAENGQ